MALIKLLILFYHLHHYFDKSNNGYITIKEIGNLYRGHIMIGDINEGLKKIIEEVGKDENGKITFDDFKRLMTNIVI